MAAPKTFRCSVITPERKILESEASFAAFTAHDGEIGILPRRAPLVCKLGIGALRLETPEPGAAGSGKTAFFIDGGFAQMAENRLSILTNQALPVAQIDTTESEQALANAKAMKISDEASALARQEAIQRAQVQLRLGSTGRAPTRG